MAFKLAVASSSDCPPDKNIMPGTAGGTVRIRVVTVNRPTSCVNCGKKEKGKVIIVVIGVVVGLVLVVVK